MPEMIECASPNREYIGRRGGTSDELRVSCQRSDESTAAAIARRLPSCSKISAFLCLQYRASLHWNHLLANDVDFCTPEGATHLIKAPLADATITTRALRTSVDYMDYRKSCERTYACTCRAMPPVRVHSDLCIDTCRDQSMRLTTGARGIIRSSIHSSIRVLLCSAARCILQAFSREYEHIEL